MVFSKHDFFSFIDCAWRMARCIYCKLPIKRKLDKSKNQIIITIFHDRFKIEKNESSLFSYLTNRFLQYKEYPANLLPAMTDVYYFIDL